MANNQERDVIYWSKRVGTIADPYIDIQEPVTVQYGKAFLKEIPAKDYRVTVKNANGTFMVEVFTNENLTANTFYVNYTEGIVFFHNSINGQLKTLTYKGSGVILYPATRIYLNSNANTTGVRLLQNVVEFGENLKPRGNFSPGSAYVPGNIVALDGASYMNLKNSTGIAPPNSEYWQPVSQRGQKGDQGTAGQKGETGTVYAHWEKTYSPTTNYKEGALVHYEGRVYLAIQDSYARLPTNATYWSLFVDKGINGSGSVHSVNGKAGDVTLTPLDFNAISIDDKGAPNGVAQLNAAGKVIDALGNLVDGKITSVNGKIGDVQLQASDVNAPALTDFNTLAKKVTQVSILEFSDLVVGEDWTNAIQAAFNTVAPGGTVIIPKGEYRTKAFFVGTSCLITGYGTLIYDFTGADGALVRIMAENVTVESLTFKEYGVVGDFSYKAYVHSAFQNTIVKDCRFFGGMQGVHFANGSRKGKILNNIAENCQASGFLLLGTSHCLMSGNTTTSCGDGAISLFNASYCVATGNEVNTSDQGITIDAGAIGNTISGNQIFGDTLGTNASSGYYGIDLKNNSHSNTIIGNTVHGYVVGISIRYGDANDGGHLQAPSSNNVVVGNTITECHDKGFATNPSGILFQAQTGLTISNNIISRVDGIQIRGFGAGSRNSDITISGNMMNLHGINFGNMPYKAIDRTAISVSGYEAVTISGNTVKCPPERMTQVLVQLTDTTFNIFGNSFDTVTYQVFDVQGASTGQINGNNFRCTVPDTRFVTLDSTGEILIRHNHHRGTPVGYMVSGNGTKYVAEGNVYNSPYLDAMRGSGIMRVVNNENSGTGMGGGEMRYTDGKLEVNVNGEWTTARNAVGFDPDDRAVDGGSFVEPEPPVEPLPEVLP